MDSILSLLFEGRTYLLKLFLRLACEVMDFIMVTLYTCAVLCGHLFPPPPFATPPALSLPSCSGHPVFLLCTFCCALYLLPPLGSSSSLFMNSFLVSTPAFISRGSVQDPKSQSPLSIVDGPSENKYVAFTGCGGFWTQKSL